MMAEHRESRLLAELQGIDMNTLEDTAAPIVRMITTLRNRDMLLCYLRHRLTKIEEARWDLAGSIPEESLAMLSPNEREYEREYAELLTDFQVEYDLDLTRDTKPPADLYVNVLAKLDVEAFIGAESGARIDALRAGQKVFLRRGDVEPRIRQGMLEHLVD